MSGEEGKRRKFLPKPFTITRVIQNVKEALPEIESRV
jgi:hypothetical protein